MDFKGFLRPTKTKLVLFVILFVATFYVVSIDTAINCTPMKPMLGFDNFKWSALCVFAPLVLLAQLPYFMVFSAQAVAVLAGIILFSYGMSCAIVYWRSSRKQPAAPMKTLAQQ